MLLDAIVTADKVGIDAPFGWPDDFVAFVSAHQRGAPLPQCERAVLRFRETDRFVHTCTGRWPLSVASDLISVPAMRAAALLAALAERGEPVDRAGGRRVVEVYPAAALRMWGFTSSGYKRKEGRDVRRALVADLVDRTRGWLDLSGVRDACEASDDVLDALVATLIARAAACGLCVPVPAAMLERARREGWIALPMPGTWSKLARGT